MYDAFGRRIAKKLNGAVVSRYLFEGPLGPSAELNAAGQVTTRYVYGLRQNVPEYMIRASATYRLLYDERGSVREVVDASSGALVQRLDYDAFGNVTLNTNPDFQPFGFQGGLYDSATGLVRFGVRDYDPAAGRWLSRDPAGFAGGSSNLYAFVDNDPINSVDPTGLQSDEFTRWAKACIYSAALWCQLQRPIPDVDPPIGPRIEAPTPVSPGDRELQKLVKETLEEGAQDIIEDEERARKTVNTMEAGARAAENAVPELVEGGAAGAGGASNVARKMISGGGGALSGGLFMFLMDVIYPPGALNPHENEFFRREWCRIHNPRVPR